jgi:sporadic carbohydrate cluster protein (TIGR04323 family)
MKKARGYVFSRSFFESRVPQHIQNLVIRNFCKTNNIIYLLSASEYSMKNSYLILKSTIKKLNNIEGIVFYSIFQLPSEINERKSIYKKILKDNKKLYFAVENLTLKTKSDIDKLENILNIQNLLSDSLSKFELKKYLKKNY